MSGELGLHEETRLTRFSRSKRKPFTRCEKSVIQNAPGLILIILSRNVSLISRQFYYFCVARPDLYKLLAYSFLLKIYYSKYYSEKTSTYLRALIQVAEIHICDKIPRSKIELRRYNTCIVSCAIETRACCCGAPPKCVPKAYLV